MTRLLRIRDVMHMTGLSRSTIYRKMQEESFPKPVKAGAAAVRWIESQITEWIYNLTKQEKGS